MSKFPRANLNGNEWETIVYEMPEDGWVCFHCGERFTTYGGAEDHFGARPHPHRKVACLIKLGNERGLLMEVRKLEKRLLIEGGKKYD